MKGIAIPEKRESAQGIIDLRVAGYLLKRVELDEGYSEWQIYRTHELYEVGNRETIESFYQTRSYLHEILGDKWTQEWEKRSAFAHRFRKLFDEGYGPPRGSHALDIRQPVHFIGPDHGVQAQICNSAFCCGLDPTQGYDFVRINDDDMRLPEAEDRKEFLRLVGEDFYRDWVTAVSDPVIIAEPEPEVQVDRNLDEVVPLETSITRDPLGPLPVMYNEESRKWEHKLPEGIKYVVESTSKTYDSLEEAVRATEAESELNDHLLLIRNWWEGNADSMRSDYISFLVELRSIYNACREEKEGVDTDVAKGLRGIANLISPEECRVDEPAMNDVVTYKGIEIPSLDRGRWHNNCDGYNTIQIESCRNVASGTLMFQNASPMASKGGACVYIGTGGPTNSGRYIQRDDIPWLVHWLLNRYNETTPVPKEGTDDDDE